MLAVRCPLWEQSIVVTSCTLSLLDALLQVDSGKKCVHLEVVVDGVVGERYFVSEKSASAAYDRLVHGMRVPPAVWMHATDGFPVADRIVSTFNRYRGTT